MIEKFRAANGAGDHGRMQKDIVSKSSATTGE